MIDIESIGAVVGMVPFSQQIEGQKPRFYLAEKLGLDVYSGDDDDDDDDDAE